MSPRVGQRLKLLRRLLTHCMTLAAIVSLIILAPTVWLMASSSKCVVLAGDLDWHFPYEYRRQNVLAVRSESSILTIYWLLRKPTQPKPTDNVIRCYFPPLRTEEQVVIDQFRLARDLNFFTKCGFGFVYEDSEADLSDIRGFSLTGVPYWFAIGLLSLLPILKAAQLIRKRRHPAGSCQKCGYNLTGNLSGVCPECGLTQPSAAVVAGV